MSGEAFPICRLVAGMMPCDAHRLGNVPAHESIGEETHLASTPHHRVAVILFA